MKRRATASPASGTRSLLRDRAYEYIHQRIVTGAYPQGSFLSEREIAAELQMSKTPIRVAFERLAEKGLVTIAPQRGVIVRALTSSEISDHYELRIALETFVMTRLGQIGLRPADRAAIEANLSRQDAAVLGDVDINAFHQADGEFHILLATALGNAEIVRVMQQQRELVHRVVATIFDRDPRAPGISVEEHHQIYRALLEGAADAAAEAVRVHLTNGHRFLLLGGNYASS